MELKIGVQELARALARSQGIVEKKSTMPILSHVLLEATKTDGLHVSATDLDGLKGRFRRGTTDATGAGLGLAIVETIMRQSNGRLDLTSPIPGRSDGFEARLVFSR